MRRREVLKLFETEYKIDPATGKEKRVNRYIGPWYTFDKKQRKACAIKGGIAWLLGVAAFITAGVMPTWAGLCNYVVPWLILCMLPLCYLGMGVVKLLRLKDEFTEIDKAESTGRSIFSFSATTSAPPAGWVMSARLSSPKPRMYASPSMKTSVSAWMAGT